MKVACIQLSTKSNYKNNFIKVLKFIKSAIRNGADLIITPETTSYMSDNKKDLLKNSFEMNKDPLVKECKIIAKKEIKWILIGSLIIKENNKLKNRSIMIGPKGKINGYYDKINMFDVNIPGGENHKESRIYKAGKKLVTINLPWGLLGLSICYDLRFPELYRHLSKKKISFISVPSAFTKMTGKKHWLELLKARAIENFCYIFAPNQFGKNTNTKETYGHSVIISPDGDILRILKNGEGIIYAKIDPHLPKKLKKIIPSSFK